MKTNKLSNSDLLKINDLLDKWKQIIQENAKNSIKNASRIKNNNGRIKTPKNNKIIIYDIKTHKKQCDLQAELSKIIPKLKDLIESHPSILDHEWKIEDYIELCYYHYTMVIEKIRKIINE